VLRWKRGSEGEARLPRVKRSSMRAQSAASAFRARASVYNAYGSKIRGATCAL